MKLSRFGMTEKKRSIPVIRSWPPVTFSPEFSCSFSLLEGNILVVVGCGFSAEESERESLAFGKAIIDEWIPPDEPYIIIHDWRRYRNSTSKARKLFMDFVIASERLSLIVFCNCDLSQSLSIKLGRALGFLKATVFVTPTYQGAVRVAAGFRESGKLPPERMAPFRFRGSRSFRQNEDLLEYLESIDWKTGRLSGNFEVDTGHPLLPVFDTITVIRSRLEQTFAERDRAERELREYRDNLEAQVLERTAALESSERRYRYLLAVSPSPTAVLSPFLTVDHLNAAFVSLFGFTPKDFSAYDDFIAALCPSAESEAAFRNFVDAGQSGETGQSGERDIELRTMSGKLMYAQVSLNTLPDAVLLSFTDITDRKKAESRLVELSIVDELTGIYNRRHFEEVLAAELRRAAETDAALALLLIDIDFFKRINDTYGHQAGDSVLREFCARVGSRVRDFDRFFRIGGEEFAIIMPTTALAEAAIVADRLRLAVSTGDFFTGNHSIPVSISVGIAAPGDGSSDSVSLFQAADALLYRAKNEGRNRVCVES